MILVFLHLLAHALWVRRASSSSNKQSARQKEAERPIRPLPDVLVWPSLPLLALKFFATGLTKSSLSTLTSPQLAAAAAANANANANANATAHDDPDGAANAAADCASLRHHVEAPRHFAMAAAGGWAADPPARGWWRSRGGG